MASSSLPSRNTHVVTELTGKAQIYMEKLASVWNDCGYNEESIQQRCDTIVEHFQGLFEEMLDEEKRYKDAIIQKIENYLRECADLSKALGFRDEVNGYEDLPLSNVERTLRYKVEDYRKIRDARLETLSSLQNREHELCEILGIPCYDRFTNEVPTEQQLQEFEAYLNEQNEVKARLMQSFQESKSAIVCLMTELEIIPTLEFEKNVVCEEDTDFKLTKENMAALRHLHQRLERQLEDTKMEAAELREKLSQLWDRLHEDLRHRETFIASHKGHSVATLKALKIELRRCEELKRQNIRTFVEQIRRELKDWWDRCLVSEEQRMQFLPYSSDCFTEDLLELHELEVQKFRRYYEEYTDIFELAKKRQNLWNKMLELEERANDPDRLFHNRGGQLLQEEKERKNIQKKLPKVENELLRYTKLYEQEHNRPFKIYDQCISDIIKQQWAAHEENKEEQKKAKKLAKDHLLEVESKLGSQLKITKRKLVPTTPVQSSTKLRRIDGNGRATERTHVKRTGVSRNIVTQFESNPEQSAASNETTYTNFQDRLEVLNQEAICRSSVVPGHCLRERNTPAKTPCLRERNTPNVTSRIMPLSSMKKTPQSQVTPIKPPRKNIRAGQQFSALRGTPSSPVYPRTTPRLTTRKGRLPIII